MKTLFTLVLGVLLSTSLLHAAAFEKVAKFRTTKVHISSDKPLSSGSNTLLFDISQKGAKAKDVEVTVKAFMPAMPGMPAMESKVKATPLGNGVFKATLNIAMGGTWQIHIFITPKTGKKTRVKTSINF